MGWLVCNGMDGSCPWTNTGACRWAFSKDLSVFYLRDALTSMNATLSGDHSAVNLIVG